MNKNIIFKIVLMIFLWSFGQSQASEVTIMVTGMGIDKYTIKKKADGSEIGTYATGTFAKVEIGEGTDIEVSLNNLSKTKDNLNQDWIIESGYILVSGKGFDNYSVYYNNDKLTETKTNVYKEFFSDLSYTVKLNKGEYFEPVKPPARLYAGSVVIKGQGIDRYSIFSQETELAGKETGEELEFFPGTYTVKLNNTIETVPIQANLRTEMDAGGILVSGAGNSFYSLVNGDEEIGQKKTGEIIEVFKGTYSVKLNKDIKENIIINPGDINKSLNSHALIFKGTGGYPFYVFNSPSSDFDTENALASSTSDKALDLFTGEYIVRLNNINKDINLTDSQELTITPGRLLVTGTGEEKYNILDAQGNQLAIGVAGQEIDLFQGTYSVTLNNTSSGSFDISENTLAPKSLYPVSILVEGMGIDKYMVTFPDNTLVADADTNVSIPVFQGEYNLILNSSVQKIIIPQVQESGQKETVQAGYIDIQGTGQTDVTYFDTQGNQLAIKKTNASGAEDNILEVFPGTYIAVLNNTSASITVAAGENESVITGSVQVSGQSSDNFFIYDLKGSYLGYSPLNSAFELFPETYKILYNGSIEQVVEPGEAVNISLGSLVVSGAGNDKYFVIDTLGNEIASVNTDETLELFAGSYNVRLNNILKAVVIEPEKTSKLTSGVLTVQGSGEDDFYILDSLGVPVAGAKTNQGLDLFGGTYTVSLNNSKTQALVITVQADALPSAEKRSVQEAADLSDPLTALKICSGEIIAELNEADMNQDGIIDLIDAVYGLQVISGISIPKTVLKAGALTITGQGIDFFEVYNSQDTFLVYKKTGRTLEFFAGNYIVKLNNSINYAEISQGQTVVLETGIVNIPKTGTDMYNVRDSQGNILKENIPSGTNIELFPGNYIIEFNGTSKNAVIEAGRIWNWE